MPRLILLLVLIVSPLSFADPLPSWQDRASKQTLLSFVAATTRPGEQFVPIAQRIAVFDNDGTLWAEQPIYFQLQFAIDRIKALAGEHPEWQETEPYATVLNGSQQDIAALDAHALITLVMATHADMSTEVFAAVVADWISTARHAKTGKAYTELVYQPMLELLAYLRANHYKTYIVSGGGIEFMRVFSERVYGIPPEQVIGSSIVTRFVMNTDGPMLVRDAEVNFVDDKAGKPVAINQHIGRRPVIAFGNSDGDLQMLQWTTAGEGPRLGGLIRHTDRKREWAYDRKSAIGKLDKALDSAPQSGWLVVDMKRDWRRIWP